MKGAERAGIERFRVGDSGNRRSKSKCFIVEVEMRLSLALPMQETCAQEWANGEFSKGKENTLAKGKH